MLLQRIGGVRSAQLDQELKTLKVELGNPQEHLFAGHRHVDDCPGCAQFVWIKDEAIELPGDAHSDDLAGARILGEFVGISRLLIELPGLIAAQIEFAANTW